MGAGFRLNRTYALRWDEGTDLAGLEVDMKSTSVGTYTELKALVITQDGARLAEILVEHIKRWNLEDEQGEPLPVSIESMLAQELVLLAEIARQWARATAGISAPLVLESINTASSAEESIPMETS